MEEEKAANNEILNVKIESVEFVESVADNGQDKPVNVPEAEAKDTETKGKPKAKTPRKRTPKTVIEKEISTDNGEDHSKENGKEKPSLVANITFETLDADMSLEEHEEVPEEETFDNLSKEELVHMLETIVKENDINEIRNKVARLKVNFWKLHKDDQQKHLEKYLVEGGKKEEYLAPEDALEDRYNIAFTIYKEKKNKFLEAQELQKQDNLKNKLQLLEELKVLINSEETLKKTYDDFRNLQEKWSMIGQVPRTETNTLWQNYHFLVDKFFDKVKINKELKDLDLRKNMEKQLALCEKAEELLLEPSILRSFKLLQKYHDDWKEIGPVPMEKKEELWERFKNATDRINQRRREYYDNLHGEQENNLIAKVAFCEKVEQINTAEYHKPNDWKVASEQVMEIQKAWKTIGYAPKKENNEIWERFRMAVNNFHIIKNDYFNKIKEEQLNNYNLKLNICAQADALQDSQDWKKTTNEMIRLQNEWKSIGPVPLKYSDKIWKRFRATCDHFFESKSNYFSNLDKNQDDNLKQKLDLIKKVEDYVIVEDNNENLNNLKEFQREWMNIGHVPSGDKDKIYHDFKNAIDRHFEKLKAGPSDKIDFKYKARFDNVQNSPNAELMISKELSFMTTKMSSIKNDIKLWENNIGFLAHSKNADILREEFTKKINSAKDQLKSLEEKQKYLAETKRNLKKK
jgi:hypothetical protein